MKNEIIEDYDGEELMFLPSEFDCAIMGIYDNKATVIYSEQKIIEVLTIDMSEEDALEYYEYNIKCAYVGEKTPIYCKTYN